MGIHRRTKSSVLCLMLAAAVTGCATNPSADKDEYGVFYDGESEASYATAFPVSSPEEAYRNGDAALSGGDYDRALFEYIRGLRLSESPDMDILYKVGNIHYARENFRLAELAYRWVLENKPLDLKAGTGLGLLLLKQRQYDAAKEQLQIVSTSGRASWQAFNALGVIADMEDKFDEAEVHYQKALEIHPRSAKVFNNLGYSRYLAGDWEGAGAALQRALRLDNHYDRAWRNLGLVYARQKKYQRALEALARTGDDAEAHNDVGYVAMLEGDYPRALSFFDKAMRLSPAFYVTASENADNVRRMLNRHNLENHR